MIDVPVFKGKNKVFQFTRSGKKIIDPKTNKHKMIEITRDVGSVDFEFIKKHNPTKNSKPHKFADAFISHTIPSTQKIQTKKNPFHLIT